MYSPKFKEKMLQRLHDGSGMTAYQLSRESGVAASTLYQWVRDSVSDVVADDDDPEKEAKPKARRELTPMDKARLLAEAESLPDEEVGGWLRQHGLHRDDLEQWRVAIEEALELAKARKRRKQGEKQVKALERELRKKEKALAEVAALLVLRKKAQALWGDEDDDTEPS